MVNRLKTLFFVLVLSVSVFSGTPLQGGDMNMSGKACPMKCCKNRAKAHKPKNADAKYLCRVLVCSQNMPTNTSTKVQVNFAPVIIALEKGSLFEMLFSTTPKENVPLVTFKAKKQKISLPKYIQHQRILV